MILSQIHFFCIAYKLFWKGLDHLSLIIVFSCNMLPIYLLQVDPLSPHAAIFQKILQTTLHICLQIHLRNPERSYLKECLVETPFRLLGFEYQFLSLRMVLSPML